ncbi:MAG: hypothetical protein DJ555_05995 [Desulfurococcaceae archaeon]|jgi:uncharacterized protein (UPF0210 family)|nr:MAG: hypothetical protein DJ555_05995 [Desulfurococcaceae archaeon]
MIIRSVTLHITDPEKISLEASRLLNIVKIVEDKGYRVWSKRITLPPLNSQGELARVCFELKRSINILKGIFVSAFNIDADSNIEIDDLVKCMEDLGFAFSSILVKDEEDVEDAYEKIYRFYSRSGVDLHTRIALIYSSRILTPYFPASASITEETSFTVALRYAADFEDLVIKKGDVESLGKLLEELEEILSNVSIDTGVKYDGIDLSLSPWMEESVASIVERSSGTEIPMPGTMAAIRRINETIASLSRRVKSTGYNELMLPVEEDNVLKERARQGRIALKDLIAFSTICVAGVDMVVLPREHVLSGRILRNIIQDLLAISEAKGKPVGMRLILASGSPGDVVDLGRFGYASIMRIS